MTNFKLVSHFHFPPALPRMIHVDGGVLLVLEGMDRFYLVLQYSGCNYTLKIEKPSEEKWRNESYAITGYSREFKVGIVQVEEGGVEVVVKVGKVGKVRGSR